MNVKLLNLIKSSLWAMSFISSGVLAGDLDAPTAPNEVGSAMFTLQDICNRLDIGTAGSKRSGAFTEPSDAPASTGCSIDTIMTKLPAEDGNAAVATEVASGQTFWSLKNGEWGLKTGSRVSSNIERLTDDSESVAAGTYGATTLSTVEPDLNSNNIKFGVTIFGISGNSNVRDTSSNSPSFSYQLEEGKKGWSNGTLIIGTASC